MMRVVVDTDNALGSPSGDVDDAFALAALFASEVEIEGVTTVFGNTTLARAVANTTALAADCRFTGPILSGAAVAGNPDSEAARWLSKLSAASTRFLALGPLTNLAATRNQPWSECIVIGSNVSSSGRFPPWWPIEFNLTKDVSAARAVFDSDLPLTIFPLDRISSFRITRSRLARLAGTPGRVLRRGSQRWFLRNMLFKLSTSFRVCDLVAAGYVIAPELFVFEQTTATMARNTHMQYDSGSRPVKVLSEFDHDRLWSFVERLFAQSYDR